MNRAYRVALICGAVPLVFGVSIFLLWLITHWVWLMMAGIFTLYSGLVIFAVGIIALARFHSLALRTPDTLRRRLRLSTLACAGFLLSNLLVAGAIISTVVSAETGYTVVIHSTSQQPLDRVRVFGGGCNASFGSIPPKGIARRSFWI